jgi:hypothetical protein
MLYLISWHVHIILDGASDTRRQPIRNKTSPRNFGIIYSSSPKRQFMMFVCDENQQGGL